MPFFPKPTEFLVPFSNFAYKRDGSEGVRKAMKEALGMPENIVHGWASVAYPRPYHTINPAGSDYRTGVHVVATAEQFGNFIRLRSEYKGKNDIIGLRARPFTSPSPLFSGAKHFFNATGTDIPEYNEFVRKNFSDAVHTKDGPVPVPAAAPIEIKATDFTGKIGLTTEGSGVKVDVEGATKHMQPGDTLHIVPPAPKAAFSIDDYLRAQNRMHRPYVKPEIFIMDFESIDAKLARGLREKMYPHQRRIHDEIEVFMVDESSWLKPMTEGWKKYNFKPAPKNTDEQLAAYSSLFWGKTMGKTATMEAFNMQIKDARLKQNPDYNDIRDKVLEEVAVVFDKRAADILADSRKRTGSSRLAMQSAILRHENSAKLIRTMKGGVSGEQARADRIREGWTKRIGRKFYIDIKGEHMRGVRRVVAYFYDNRLVKVDGEHTYMIATDNRLDWLSVDPIHNSRV